MDPTEKNISGGFLFITFTQASSYLMFMCSCTLIMNCLTPKCQEEHKIPKRTSWAAGVNGGNGILKTGTAKAVKSRWGAGRAGGKKKSLGFAEWNVFSYSTSFLQAAAFKGQRHNLNIYFLYSKPVTVISIKPNGSTQVTPTTKTISSQVLKWSIIASKL